VKARRSVSEKEDDAGGERAAGKLRRGQQKVVAVFTGRASSRRESAKVWRDSRREDDKVNAGVATKRKREVDWEANSEVTSRRTRVSE
jgi:hypothetical protein